MLRGRVRAPLTEAEIAELQEYLSEEESDHEAFDDGKDEVWAAQTQRARALVPFWSRSCVCGSARCEGVVCRASHACAAPHRGPQDVSTCIIVDNLPVVPEAKVGKLRTFVEKIFAQVAPIVNMSMPMTAAGMSEGYALIEYPKADDATKAVASTNGYDFDKSHKLIVNHFGDFRRFAAVPEVYAEPARVALETADDLNDWLLDAAVRDEYVVRHESETEVYWSDNAGPPVPDYCGEREKREGKTWTEREVMWSPHGTYLLTFHAAGVALWGGKNFRKLARFPHPDVSHAAFSPDERLLATWNGMPENDTPDDALIVWDARTGQQLRTFKQVCGVAVVCVCVCVACARFFCACCVHVSRAARRRRPVDGGRAPRLLLVARRQVPSAAVPRRRDGRRLHQRVHRARDGAAGQAVDQGGGVAGPLLVAAARERARVVGARVAQLRGVRHAHGDPGAVHRAPEEPVQREGVRDALAERRRLPLRPGDAAHQVEEAHLHKL